MAKGDDAVRRKRNKTHRKRMRNSESAISARVASIIAAKHRRKDGKRRICEGMCFSLPTPGDPFNDRHGKKGSPKTRAVRRANEKRKSRPLPKEVPPPCPAAENKVKEVDVAPNHEGEQRPGGGDGGYPDYSCPSKFLILCLNAIQDAWVKEGASDGSVEGNLLASTWGVEFWRCCSAGSNVSDTSGACASREQIAWLVSTASDILAQKEKQGIFVTSPFLFYLVPSQEKAVQVRSLCKPLKPLGIHTVSLHPGVSIDHQVHGLKSCEPEFVVSTPERLLELVGLRAIDISSTSLLVIDGLKKFLDLGFVDKVYSIRDSIPRHPQMVIFSDSYEEALKPVVQNLLRRPVSRLSLYDSSASQSAFISQHVHFCTSEEDKLLKAIQILARTLSNQTPHCVKAIQILARTLSNQTPHCVKVLFILGTASKVQMLISSLDAEGYAVSIDSASDCFIIADSEKVTKVTVKDKENVLKADVEEFEMVMFVDLPSSIEDYVEILTRIARHAVTGVLHSFFCKADAALSQPLINVLEHCGQMVPEVLRSFDSS